MAAAQKNRYGAVYGLAKGLGMDRESLHEYIYRETGRASLTELTDPELRRLVVSMGRMKDGGQQAPRRKRTDAGGNPETAAQCQKLAEALKAMARREAAHEA